MNRLVVIVCLVSALAVSARNVIQFEMEKEGNKILNMLDFLKANPTSFRHKGQSQTKKPLRLTDFRWKDCSGEKDLMQLLTLKVSPDPIVSPGSLFVEATGIVRDLVDTPLQADLILYEKISENWVKMPCIQPPLGSCHIDDLCVLLSTISPCPEAIEKSGLGCYCPFKPGKVNLKMTDFEIGNALPEGDFHAIGNLTYNGKPAGCLDIYISLAE